MAKHFKQPSVMQPQERFSTVPSANIDRSKFNRSHAYKTTFDAGKLIPVYVDEVLPGDTFHMKAQAFTRLATPIKPIMDNIKVDLQFFFVPNRLVWSEFEQFMGDRPHPDFDPNTLSVPQIALDAGSEFSELAGYFGLPTNEILTKNGGSSLAPKVNCLPFRMYNLIWNEWYRDQNLQDPVVVNTSSNSDTAEFKILPRGKRHDYFTSCLPWPQKGAAVTLPLSGDYESYPFTLDVTGDVSNKNIDFTNDGYWNETRLGEDGSVVGYRRFVTVGGVGPLSGEPLKAELKDGSFTGKTKSATITIDGSSIQSVSINDLRQAFQIQKMLERDARGGTRYIELILSHFGVVSDDARLQRPEFLGSGTFNVNMHPVSNTAGDAAPQGNLSAFAVGSGAGTFSKSFTEHGFIIGLISARSDLTYQQGINRMWSRETRYDYYWPTLAHLGEQAVLRKEIFANKNPQENELVFGYQERYAEYRYKPSLITGKFNSGVNASLDVWHLSQWFENAPVLSSEFIEENPPIKRVVAVPSEPDFLLDMWFDLICERPMPVYSVPGLVDHF